MSNLNAQLQSLAEGYNNDVSSYLSNMAQNKAQEGLDKINDLVSQETGIENLGQLVGGVIGAGSGLLKGANKVKEVYDQYQKAKNPGDINENLSKVSKESTELSDVAETGLETGAEETAEGVGLGLAQFIPGLDVVLDIGALSTLGVTLGMGLHKKHLAEEKEEKYKQTVNQAKDIQNQAHTLNNIVGVTSQKVQGGITSLD